MRSPDVMTASAEQHTSVLFDETAVRAQDTSVLLVARRHVDLGRVASALCL